MKRENTIRKEMGFYRKQLATFFQSRNDSLALKFYYQKILVDLQLQYDSLQHELQDHYPEYYRLKYDLSVVTLTETQRKLTRGQCLISYFWSEDMIYVLSVTKKKTSCWSVRLNDDLIRRLNSFQDGIRQEPGMAKTAGKDWLQLGYDLYQDLIQPGLKDDRKITSLLFIPSGKLFYLPWSALNTGTPAAASFREVPYLIKHYTLQQEYSATLLFTDIPRARLDYNYVGVAPEYTGAYSTLTTTLDSFAFRHAYGDAFRME
ncbi:MAG: CHAT domain-containing protein, partial [Sinomicrobium sp.]|nr:CHAT domain-containing protein [Sinomicrobium sp.]